MQTSNGNRHPAKPSVRLAASIVAAVTLAASPVSAKSAKLDSEATTQAIVDACALVEQSAGTEQQALSGLNQASTAQELAKAGKQLTAIWSRFSAELVKIKPAAPQDTAFLASAKSVVSTRLRRYKSFQTFALKNKVTQSIAALEFSQAELTKEDSFQRSLVSRTQGEHCVALGDWEDVDLPATPLAPEQWFKDSVSVVYSLLPGENQAVLVELQKAQKQIYKAIEGRIMKTPNGETLGQISVFLVRSSIRSNQYLFDQIAESAVGETAAPLELNPSVRSWIAPNTPIPLLDTVYAQTGNAIISFSGPASPNADRIKATAKEYFDQFFTR